MIFMTSIRSKNVNLKSKITIRKILQNHWASFAHEVIESASEFIKKLIIHIPEKHFNMLRYYGLYAKGPSAYPDLIRRISKPVRKIRRTLLKWRYALEISLTQMHPHFLMTDMTA